MIPRQEASTREAIARWMGYTNVASMDADHDRLHASLCSWLGVDSHALRDAAGEAHDPMLAALEEDAVLHLQRFMAHMAVAVPE